MENQGLARENEKFRKELTEKDDYIKQCEAQMRLNEKGKGQDFNRLNSKLNEALITIEQLKKENEELKYKKRAPLAPIKVENSDNSNILNLLKQREKVQTTGVTPLIRHDKPISVQPPSREDQDFHSSSQHHLSNHSSELAPTQFTMEGDEPESGDHKPMYQTNYYDQTYDQKDNVPVFQETIDLRAHNDQIPPSSPIIKSESQKEVHSSPISNRVKIKTEDCDSIEEIKDSQNQTDDELDRYFPTPKTTTKFQTPSHITQNLNFKKSLLHTPDDLTPMKNIKKAKTSTTLDLSINPIRNRPWIPEDFKINPAKNGDLDFAYHSVLRGENRQCVHGKSCKDCENFYRVAQGDKIPKSNTGLRWNAQSPVTQNIIAKTSRHRTIWDRVESPPGFGDFDFPDTQQQKKNREKSDKIRDKKAYERLYSAINNGRFMFRNKTFNEALQSKSYTLDQSVFEKYINVDLDK